MVWLLRWHRIKHTKRDDQPESKKKDTLEIKVFSGKFIRLKMLIYRYKVRIMIFIVSVLNKRFSNVSVMEISN